MSCKNHPLVTAIAHCERCEIPICGICTRYHDECAYCERCVDVVESEEYSKARAKAGVEKFRFSLDEEPVAAKEATPEQKATSKNRVRWQLLVAIGAVFYSGFFIYANPELFSLTSEERAQIEKDDALETCRLIFEEIGMMLENNIMPDESMRCAESDIPNIVTQDGELFQISHPNPAVHGYSEIYVTNFSHETILVP